MTKFENNLFSKLAMKYLPISIQLLALKTEIQYLDLADIKERLEFPINLPLPTEKATGGKKIVINFSERVHGLPRILWQ